MIPSYVYRARVDRVIDGDTYVLTIDLGFRCAIQIEGRLHGVDTPELPTQAGLDARNYVNELMLESGDLVVVQSYRDRRSFARWVVDVWLPDGRNLADVIVDAGMGVRIP